MAGKKQPAYIAERKAFFKAYRKAHPKLSLEQAYAHARPLWEKTAGGARERAAIAAGQRSLGYRKLTQNMVEHGVPHDVARRHSIALRKLNARWHKGEIDNIERNDLFYHDLYNHDELVSHYSYDIHEYYQQEEGE